MKITTAVIAILMAGLLATASFCHAQDDFVTEYLRTISLFSPVTSLSAKEMNENGKPAYVVSPIQKNPFSYINSKPLEVPDGVRAIVFVPHPDDEALSTAGLVERVVQKGGKVRVVFVTNGDGYREAVRLKVRNSKITARDFVDYGKKRQEEARNAVCELGLQPEDAVFLGFPDDGIDDLWEVYWSKLKPFTSPHTLFDRPHRKGHNRWVKYSGVELSQEIQREIAEFSPDWVVLPDPRDEHPDHATAGVFVLAALQTLYEEGRTPFSQVLTYLVHFKDFPQGNDWAKSIGISSVGKCGTSAKTLASAGWVHLPLSAEEVEGKRRALLAHSSQLQMLHSFFRNFLLPCEIFGRLTTLQVISIPQEYAAFYKHPTN